MKFQKSADFYQKERYFLYNLDNFKAKIKYHCDLKKTSLGNMLFSLGYNRNLLSQATGNKGISSMALYAIADYLDVSLDYLLGRAERPDSHKT
jgi:hypothetical protein